MKRVQIAATPHPSTSSETRLDSTAPVPMDGRAVEDAPLEALTPASTEDASMSGHGVSDAVPEADVVMKDAVRGGDLQPARQECAGLGEETDASGSGRSRTVRCSFVHHECAPADDT